MKKILILYVKAGVGHLKAAEALKETFVEKNNVDADAVDVLDYSSKLLKLLYHNGYYLASKKAPALLDLMYKLFATIGALDGKNAIGKVGLFFHKINCRKFFLLVEKFNPDCIISTHLLPAAFIADLKRQGKLNIPTAVIITDYEVQKIWVYPEHNRYYVSTPNMQTQLEKFNVPKNAIKISGIPIAKQFSIPQPKEEAKRQLKFNPQKRLVTLIQGNTGQVAIEPIIKRMNSEKRTDFQLAVIISQKGNLDKKAKNLLSQTNIPHQIFGFVNNMSTFLFATDILISKPGGIIVTESLSCNTPMIIVNPIPGQEIANMNFLLENNAALYAQNPDDLMKKISLLLDNKKVYDGLKKNIQKIAHPQSTQTIIEDINTLLK